MEHIKQIREEANHTKHCFTQFSFQAFAISSSGLAIIVTQMDKGPAAYASIFIIGLCSFVARIGSSKYITANRNYSYELYYNRIDEYDELGSGKFSVEMKKLNWEEAMFAWRIVQASVFKKMYGKTKAKWNQRINSEYPWWNTRKLLVGKGQDASDDETVCYHAGSYLKNMQNSLHMLSMAAMFPLFYILYVHLFSEKFNFAFFDIILILALSIYISDRWRKDRRCRQILEGGLLSIQTGALLWRATIIAHLRAHEEVRETGSLRGFTFALGKQAESLVENIEDIHQWVKNGDGIENADKAESPQGNQ